MMKIVLLLSLLISLVVSSAVISSKNYKGSQGPKMLLPRTSPNWRYHMHEFGPASRRRSLLSLFFGGEVDTPVPRPAPPPPSYSNSYPYYPMTPTRLPPVPESMEGYTKLNPVNSAAAAAAVGGDGGELSIVVPEFTIDPQYNYNYLAQPSLPPYLQGQGLYGPDMTQLPQLAQMYPGLRPRPWTYPYAYAPPAYPAFDYTNSIGIMSDPGFLTSLLDVMHSFLSYLSLYSSSNSPPPEGSVDLGGGLYDEGYYNENQNENEVQDPDPVYDQFVYEGGDFGGGNDEREVYYGSQVYRSRII